MIMISTATLIVIFLSLTPQSIQKPGGWHSKPKMPVEIPPHQELEDAFRGLKINTDSDRWWAPDALHPPLTDNRMFIHDANQGTLKFDRPIVDNARVRDLLGDQIRKFQYFPLVPLENGTRNVEQQSFLRMVADSVCREGLSELVLGNTVIPSYLADRCARVSSIKRLVLRHLIRDKEEDEILRESKDEDYSNIDETSLARPELLPSSANPLLRYMARMDMGTRSSLRKLYVDMNEYKPTTLPRPNIEYVSVLLFNSSKLPPKKTLRVTSLRAITWNANPKFLKLVFEAVFQKDLANFLSEEVSRFPLESGDKGFVVRMKPRADKRSIASLQISLIKAVPRLKD